MQRTQQNRPRVLLIAEAANPDWVSVPLVGWSLARALAGVADVHLVTHLRNRDAILRAGLTEGQDFTAIDADRVVAPLWKLGEWMSGGSGKGWTALQFVSALSYPYFERLVWQKFKDEIQAGVFDIVHRITPLSPTIISPIARRVKAAGVPFVVGPLNGGVPWPKGFETERLREKEYLSYVRNAYKFMPGRMRSLRATDAIICGSGHTKSEMPAKLQDRCIYIPENAIDPTRFPEFKRRKRPSGARFKAAFVGRLVPYKGPDILLEAAAPMLKAGTLELDFIGDGPMMEELKKLASQYASQVTFHGWQPHENIQKILSSADLFAFPSIREFGGGVVLEAMASNVPVLVVDYAGPGELVQQGLGFKVPIGSRQSIVSRFQSALSHLMSQPEKLSEVKERARNHIDANLTWDRKADQIKDVYQAIVDGKPMPRPFDLDDREALEKQDAAER